MTESTRTIELWNAMPSASDGMTAQAHTAQVAEQRAITREEREQVRSQFGAILEMPNTSEQIVTAANMLLRESNYNLDAIMAAFVVLGKDFGFVQWARKTNATPHTVKERIRTIMAKVQYQKVKPRESVLDRHAREEAEAHARHLAEWRQRNAG